MYKELNKFKRKTTQDRVWSIRDLQTLSQKHNKKKQKIQMPIRSE